MRRMKNDRINLRILKMNDTTSKAPSTSEQFNKVYRSPLAHWMWTDIRIPEELIDLVNERKPQTSLEFGCGLGRFTKYIAEQGIEATGVDFSSVAIANAIESVSKNKVKPAFLVGDVTRLEMLNKKFDISYDIGCFHCLNEEGQVRYVSEVHRLLKPGGVHLIWALDSSPAEIKLSPGYIARTFDNKFKLINSRFSRRRLIASHWYWLVSRE